MWHWFKFTYKHIVHAQVSISKSIQFATNRTKSFSEIGHNTSDKKTQQTSRPRDNKILATTSIDKRSCSIIVHIGFYIEWIERMKEKEKSIQHPSLLSWTRWNLLFMRFMRLFFPFLLSSLINVAWRAIENINDNNFYVFIWNFLKSHRQNSSSDIDHTINAKLQQIEFLIRLHQSWASWRCYAKLRLSWNTVHFGWNL